ncbi:hypothetical protein [Flavobacterium sp. GSA192]|uniref:hypothetical protein n=1 Tax=Flavobacterium sp. GSA192 TaxID=2576304 RepID=UPI00112A1D62|nr:hypothetical protein [Flavobacterium sp. GSA192]
MRKIIFLPILIFLLGCSNNDDENNEFIVGKWKVVKRYDSGIETDLSSCDPFYIYDFGADFSVETYVVNKNEVPQNVLCGVYFSGMFSWVKIDENTYQEIRTSDPSDVNHTYTRDGKFLIINYPDNRSAVLKRD